MNSPHPRTDAIITQIIEDGGELTPEHRALVEFARQMEAALRIDTVRQPQTQTHRIDDVTPDGDGDWTVTLANGAYLTVRPDDLPHPPKAGDYILVQLPIAIGYADEWENTMSAARELLGYNRED